MRYFCVSAAFVFLILSISGPPALAAGNKADSRVLCYIGTPWPWLPKACCEKEQTGGVNRSIDRFIYTGVLASSDIEFETDSAELKPESKKVLDEVGEVLREWPEAEVEISGHTDSSGEEAYNQKLSEKRAETVRAYLLENFHELRKENLRTVGYGEKRPEASNGTAEGRRINRRVEFRIMNLDDL